MKQEVYTNGQKTSSTPVPATRYRPTPKTKENPTTGSPNRVRPKSVTPITATSNTTRRSINFNRVRPVPVVPVPVSTEEDKCKELQKRLDLSENTVKELQRRVEASDNSVKELQGEVSELRAHCQRLNGVNSELEAHKKRLEGELTAAKEKIRQLEINAQKRGLQDLQKATERKLQISNKIEEATKQTAIMIDLRSNNTQTQTKITTTKRPFPPPPPPPPVTGRPPPPPPPPHQHANLKSNGNAVHKASALVELYNSMTKQNGKKDQIINGNCSSPIGRNQQNNILGELQNRSAHLIAIKSDVETKGDFIRDLIEKVQLAAYTKMEDVLKFVDWIDRELSTLSDERAVLKHFNWPERKADSMREAAIEFRYFKSLESEIDYFKDDTSVPCDVSLRKISSLLDKLEKGMERLIRLRSLNMVSYKDCKIPTDWLQESGMVSKIKLASVKLAKVYMKRVARELDSARNSERETVQESLLFQGVRFAYRVHQFAGGLDSETMGAFEELRERIRAQEHGSGSKELLPGVMLSR
ncbi:protein CHUP1, chloroplastic-like [Carex rostrata]